jgi:hypothetical protein
MTVNVLEIIKKMKPDQRKKVEERAAKLIAEEMKLPEPQKPRKPSRKRAMGRS